MFVNLCLNSFNSPHCSPGKRPIILKEHKRPESNHLYLPLKSLYASMILSQKVKPNMSKCNYLPIFKCLILMHAPPSTFVLPVSMSSLVHLMIAYLLQEPEESLLPLQKFLTLQKELNSLSFVDS